MFRNFIEEIVSLIQEFFSQEESWILLFLLIIGGFLFVKFSGFNLEPLWLALISFIKKTWWFWLFLIFLPITASLWLFWRNEKYKSEIEWSFLEIKIPRENKKDPEAMEQVLYLLHSLRNAPGDPREKWWDGEVTRWFSLEILSFGGEIHYYLRCYKKQKNLVEAAFYSYYPDVEVVEVKDYVENLPKNLNELYQKNYDLWGTEMVLNKSSLYPIKTYRHFFVSEETKIVDPMSGFLEVLGKLKPGEIVGVQILIAPTGHDWRDKYQKDFEDLKSKLKKTKEVPTEKEELEETPSGPATLSPAEIFILKEIENNLSKPAFNTLIRFIYLSPKDIFYESYARRGLVGIFNQFAHLSLNSFRQNYKMSTRVTMWVFPYFFSNLRVELRKARLLRNYRLRDLPPQTFMGRLFTSHPLNWNFGSRTFEMNVEGIATIFHLPTAMVLTTPFAPRIESRKISPTVGLPIFGEEKDIEKFK